MRRGPRLTAMPYRAPRLVLCRCCAALLATRPGSHSSVASPLIDPLGPSSATARRNGNSSKAHFQSSQCRGQQLSACAPICSGRPRAVLCDPPRARQLAPASRLDGRFKYTSASRQLCNAAPASCQRPWTLQRSSYPVAVQFVIFYDNPSTHGYPFQLI